MTITVNVTAIPSNHYLHLLWSIASLAFICKSCIYILVYNFFPCFSRPTFCLAPSASKVTHCSPNCCHCLLKHVHTIAVYFFGPLLWRILFLAAALIEQKIVYSSYSHRTSIYSASFLPDAVRVDINGYLIILLFYFIVISTLLVMS